MAAQRAEGQPDHDQCGELEVGSHEIEKTIGMTDALQIDMHKHGSEEAEGKCAIAAKCAMKVQNSRRQMSTATSSWDTLVSQKDSLCQGTAISSTATCLTDLSPWLEDLSFSDSCSDDEAIIDFESNDDDPDRICACSATIDTKSSARSSSSLSIPNDQTNERAMTAASDTLVAESLNACNTYYRHSKLQHFRVRKALRVIPENDVV
eukprot:TRINITY_DN14422_c0_g2_i1.p1 TRINITY_DN14422_c0_g2~~TRINITY_DN14422_c0_g2_i1.p1  ORF type:complete len:207 (+),score=23.88 TRINITY_DN14422_c0_g2_i1:62-682(+)